MIMAPGPVIRALRFADRNGGLCRGFVPAGGGWIHPSPPRAPLGWPDRIDGRPVAAVNAVNAVRLLPPVLPRVVACVGLNHRSTQELLGAPPGGEPMFFHKAASSVIGPDDEIRCPRGVDALDVAGELAVVIGRTVREVPPTEALRYVFGLTCANDVAVRAWMTSEAQWFNAKSADGFCPLGPWVVPYGDGAPREVTLAVNGAVRQQGSTDELVVGVPELIAAASRHITLRPGDVLLTGSPGGPVTARPGDLVEVSIDGIGTLRNRIADTEPTDGDRSSS